MSTSDEQLGDVGGDAAVMLEFLALSRQQVLHSAQLVETKQVYDSFTTESPIDLLFTAEQMRTMVHYHQENLSWIHNVVHMPTFMIQCERAISGDKTLDISWYSLYYALVAVC